MVEMEFDSADTAVFFGFRSNRMAVYLRYFHLRATAEVQMKLPASSLIDKNCG